jgi:hypothetical protein
VSRDLDVLVAKDPWQSESKLVKTAPAHNVRDIWPENYERFSGKRLTKRQGCLTTRMGGYMGRTGCLTGRTKEEPFKNEHLNNGSVKKRSRHVGGSSNDNNRTTKGRSLESWV